MKPLSKILPVLLVFSVLMACAPKTLPPELKPAYTANEVLIRVQELQKTTIALYDSTPRAISPERARLIVQFTVSAAEVIKNSLNGWTATVKSLWTELKSSIKLPEKGLETIWILLDAMILALPEKL